MSLSNEIKEMIEKCGCENPEKVALIVFCTDGRTKTFYGDMNLKDMALAKHEIELDIIDKFILTNADRYNVPCIGESKEDGTTVCKQEEI